MSELLRLAWKRLLLGCGLVLLLAGLAALLVPACRTAVLQWFTGEPYCRGRPASAWSAALREEAEAGGPIHLLRGGSGSVIDELVKESGTEPVAVLLVLLTDEDEYVRRRAAEGLARLRPQDPATVAALTERLLDDSPAVRWESAEALGHIGLPAARALPELERALRDADDRVRGSAVRALGRIGPTPAGDPVPQLIVVLRDADEFMRWEAAEALERIGPEARAAVPALQTALRDESPYVRGAAAKALQRIQSRREGSP